MFSSQDKLSVVYLTIREAANLLTNESHLSRKMMTTNTYNEERKQTGSNCTIHRVVQWHIPEEENAKQAKYKPNSEGRE